MNNQRALLMTILLCGDFHKWGGQTVVSDERIKGASALVDRILATSDEAEAEADARPSPAE